MKSSWIRGLLAAALLAGAAASPAGAATSPADPNKVLRYVFIAPETNFDPAVARDLYSSHVIQSIYEALYNYDYMARPARLRPLTAEALPEVSADGLTYTIRLKKGIFFTPDPVFGGKPRELTMQDYVYTFKRLADPQVASAHSWMLEGKVVGFDEMVAEAKKTGKYNYDAPVSGFELVDKYTLRIHLKQPDFNLGMILAHTPMGAVAREVVEKYRDGHGHMIDKSIGTGPYILENWVRGSRIDLVANPNYRGFTWDFEAGSDPEDQDIVKKLKGRKFPQIGRVEIFVMQEDQSRWLAFQNDEVDLFQLEGALAPRAIGADGKLLPELAQKGVVISKFIDPETSVVYWNMKDPILGGFSKEKIALRRAIAMAHNVEEEIKIVWNGQAVPLQYPVPPGVVGYDPNYKSLIQYDPAAANALLDKFGYKRGKDGWRTLPDGKPLTIRYVARADGTGQHLQEMWKKTYDKIHIRMTGDRMLFPDILKAEKECKIPTRTMPWIADFPDGDNFMQLTYGPNIGQNNNGCVAMPEFDALYKASQQLPNGPERDAMYHKMARYIDIYTPQRVLYARFRTMLGQPRLIGFKKHPIMPTEWMFYDIEKRK